MNITTQAANRYFPVDDMGDWKSAATFTKEYIFGRHNAGEIPLEVADMLFTLMPELRSA